MRILKIILLSIFAVLLFSVVLLIMLGGGFGRKDNLPLELINRSTPFLFAHRGAASPAPDNSYLAILNARKRGYPAIEIDIQQNIEGRFFLFHDKEAYDMLGFPGMAWQMTLEELQKPLIRFNGQTTSQKVITLEKVLADFGNDFIIYIDLKRYGVKNYFQLAGDINRILEKFDLYDSVIISNAHFLLITYLEYRYPQIITCLEGFKPPMQSYFFWIPKNFRPDFIATFHQQINNEYVQWLKKSGMINRYIAFTVENEIDLGKILNWGIEKFLVDDGGYLDSLLNKPTIGLP